jgi:Tat protein secretion system quality control protein TatD with DNase activity
VFPNEPKNVRYVLERLAELRGVSVDEMAAQVEQNVKALFRKLH